MNIKDLKDTFRQSALYGNREYGKEFDDIKEYGADNLSFPTAIVVRKGDIVDNAGFVYGDILLEHGGYGGGMVKFPLEEGEHIVRVAGSQTRFGGVTLIEALEFETDKKRVLSAGHPGPQSGRFEYRAEEGHAICGLYGHSADYLGAIGFHTCKTGMKAGDLLDGMHKGKEQP